MKSRMDEESKQLLRRVVESMARRQLASIDILGHCLKFVGEVDVKTTVAGEVDLSLRLFRQVHALYRELGWTDIESAVRDRLSEIPYPGSRLEFGVAYYVLGQLEQVAMQAYLDSSCPEFAAIARSYVEAAQRRPEPRRFREYCAEPTNRPQAQQFFDRWYRIALTSFARLGESVDRRIVELGLRSCSSDEMLARFRERLTPFVEGCGLAFPDADALSPPADRPGARPAAR